MIQRIQSIYLLFIAIFTGLMFILPLAQFTGDTQAITLTATAINSADGVAIIRTPYMTALIAIAALLPLVTIFLFKKRWIQIRFCVVEIILQAGIVAFLIYYITQIATSLQVYEIHSMSLQIADVFPIVNCILSWLAYRGVVKDETLVKSLDRIR